MSKQGIIVMESVEKVYDPDTAPVWALRGIDLTIRKGEFVAIMGPSGSGKSTLMHIMGCLDVPTKGVYYLEGERVDRMDDDELARIRNLRLGFVFQNFYLLPRVPAVHQVELPMIYAKVSREERQERAKELLERVGLGKRLYHYASQMSGGERQRVAIARALANNPTMIFADEPTGNLDSKTGREIMGLFSELHREGKTVILVTHDLNIAKTAERIVMLKDGRLVEG